MLSVSDSNVSTFESETDNIAGSAYLETTSISKLNFKYRKDLILVSYPYWGGKQIVHDPTYAAAYTASPPPTTTTTTTSGQTSTSASTTSTQPDPTTSVSSGGTASTFSGVSSVLISKPVLTLLTLVLAVVAVG